MEGRSVSDYDKTQKAKCALQLEIIFSKDGQTHIECVIAYDRADGFPVNDTKIKARGLMYLAASLQESVANCSCASCVEKRPAVDEIVKLSRTLSKGALVLVETDDNIASIVVPESNARN